MGRRQSAPPLRPRLFLSIPTRIGKPRCGDEEQPELAIAREKERKKTHKKMGEGTAAKPLDGGALTARRTRSRRRGWPRRCIDTRISLSLSLSQRKEENGEVRERKGGARSAVASAAAACRTGRPGRTPLSAVAGERDEEKQAARDGKGEKWLGFGVGRGRRL